MGRSEKKPAPPASYVRCATSLSQYRLLIALETWFDFVFKMSRAATCVFLLLRSFVFGKEQKDILRAWSTGVQWVNGLAHCT
jgi:hypothetical protein